jgi:lipopolysaccharide export system protein LptC
MTARSQGHWSVIAVLGSVLAATTWWLHQLEGGDSETQIEFPSEPDSYMEGVTRTTMDERGRLATRLKAERMFHYPLDDATEFTRPRLQFFDDEKAAGPWRVAADRAWVGPDNNLMLLRGDVRVWRDDDQGARVVEVLTTELEVITEDRYAQTAEAATIITPTTVSKGIGMRAQLGSNRVELLRDVHTRYEPARGH